jgi:molybdopterin converting factor small subunit
MPPAITEITTDRQFVPKIGATCSSCNAGTERTDETKMRVHVELFGLSRLIAGEKEITLTLDEGATFRHAVRALVRKYPEMIGDVVQADGETMQSPNILNLDGRRMIQPHQMAESLSDGDRIIVMSMSAGG